MGSTDRITAKCWHSAQEYYCAGAATVLNTDRYDGLRMLCKLVVNDLPLQSFGISDGCHSGIMYSMHLICSHAVARLSETRARLARTWKARCETPAIRRSSSHRSLLGRIKRE